MLPFFQPRPLVWQHGQVHRGSRKFQNAWMLGVYSELGSLRYIPLHNIYIYVCTHAEQVRDNAIPASGMRLPRFIDSVLTL